MSAYLCSDKQIATLAYASTVLTNDLRTWSVQEFANLLKSVNIHSVNYRYHTDDKENEPCDITQFDMEVIKLHDLGAFKTPEINLVKLHKLIREYLYQACQDEQHPAYVEINRFFGALVNRYF